jgi:hypothetical protein
VTSKPQGYAPCKPREREISNAVNRKANAKEGQKKALE